MLFRSVSQSRYLRAENIAKNREKWLRQNKPWVLEGLDCYEYYLKYIKPLQEKEAELEKRVDEFERSGKLLEAQRIKMRTK